MRSGAFLSLLFGAGALAVAFAAPASATILVNIDKDTQRMTVTVDGAQRYVWPVSTGRAGYDTPSGTFRPNRMDADHLSQEWDNAPMPHTMFFDLHGHAIHGFFDVKHLGMAVSHGCVRLSPDHATTLFDLVKSEGMANTSVVVTGRTPGGDNGLVARSHLPENEEVYNSQPMPIAPQYQQQAPQYQEQQEYPPQQEYVQRQGFPQQPQPYYGQRYYAQPQPYYGGQPYSGQGYDAPPGYYGQPAYRQW